MNKHKTALKKFLKSWEEKDYCLAAMVFGSYAVGNSDKYSDIDVNIILSDSVKWRERGNQIIDGVMVEYFANSVSWIKKYQEDNYANGNRITARMYGTGKIIFDKTGIAKKLQIESKKQLSKKFAKKDKAWIELKKYQMWDRFDELKVLKINKCLSFNFVLQVSLLNILETYSQFLGIDIPPVSKIQRFISDKNYRKNYQIDKFSDANFLKLFNKCLEIKSLQNFKILTEYTLDKMGGFNIDGWCLRSYDSPQIN